MTNELLIGLIGDKNPDVTAHRAIPPALQIAASVGNVTLKHEWLPTPSAAEILSTQNKNKYNGLWCVPGSPYEDTASALGALNIARTHSIPTLGSCGGFQHMVIEFAQNELGYKEADNAEINPTASMPLIAPLACSLIEETGHIVFAPDSVIAKHYGDTSTEEKYHCNFGLNTAYQQIFTRSAMLISGTDETSEPRAIEHTHHPFYIGVAFQPERSALNNKPHPLISAFVKVAARQAT